MKPNLLDKLKRQMAAVLLMVSLAAVIALLGGGLPSRYLVDIGGADGSYVGGMALPTFAGDKREISYRLTGPQSSLRFPGWRGPATLALYAYFDPTQTAPPTEVLTLTVAVEGRVAGVQTIIRGWNWYTYTLANAGDQIALTTPVLTDVTGMYQVGVALDLALLQTEAPVQRFDLWPTLALLLIAGLAGYLLARLPTRVAVAGGGLVLLGLAGAYIFSPRLFILYAASLLIVLFACGLLLRWQRPVGRLGGWLFLSFLLTYLFFVNGQISSDDDRIKHATTLAVTHLDFKLDGPILGTYYSKYGIGHSLAELPLLLPLRLADAVSGGNLPYLHKLSVLLLNPIIGALTAWLLYLTARRLYANDRLALAVALIGGLTTISAAYALLTYSETLLSCLLLLTFYAFLRHFEVAERDWRWLAVAGVALAALIVTKQEYVLAGVLAGCWWLLRSLRAQGWRAGLRLLGKGLLLAGPIAAAVAWLLIYNKIRSGSFGSSGYGAIGLLLPPIGKWLNGLYGMFLSSGKSIFLYSPPLLLLPWAISRFWRRWPWEAGLILSLSGLLVLFYCRINFWSGDLSWGARYLVPLTPLLVLPLGALLQGYGDWARAQKVGLAGLLGAGLAVQGLSAVGSFSVAFFYQYKDSSAGNYTDWQYIPAHNPLLAQLQVILNGEYNIPFSSQLSSFGLPALLDYLLPGLLVAGIILAWRQVWRWQLQAVDGPAWRAKG